MITYDDVKVRMLIYSGQVYSGCGMGAWCFGMEKEFFFTTNNNENELLAILRSSNSLDYAYEHFVHSDKPFILSDSHGIIWIGEFARDEQQEPALLFLLGPALFSRTSITGIEKALSHRNVAFPTPASLQQVLQRIPTLPLSMLTHYALMLHFTITEESIRPTAILYQPARISNIDVTAEIDAKNLEFLNIEHARSIEHMLLQFVREGNINYKKTWDQLVAFDPHGSYHTGNPMREAKDSLLIFAGLCARAAIEGGLPPHASKSVENQYITLIERAETATDLADLNTRLLDDFTSRVYHCKTNPLFSKAVHECMNYIQENLLQDFSLEDLAKSIGYTEYYLTKKFFKETGVRLTDYIKNARIEHAKIWLMTTSKSIREISDQMNFSSRNYFTKVFRENVGMTPAEYREKMHLTTNSRNEAIYP